MSTGVRIFANGMYFSGLTLSLIGYSLFGIATGLSVWWVAVHVGDMKTGNETVWYLAAFGAGWLGAVIWCFLAWQTRRNWTIHLGLAVFTSLLMLAGFWIGNRFQMLHEKASGWEDIGLLLGYVGAYAISVFGLCGFAGAIGGLVASLSSRFNPRNVQDRQASGE